MKPKGKNDFFGNGEKKEEWDEMKQTRESLTTLI